MFSLNLKWQSKYAVILLFQNKNISNNAPDLQVQKSNKASLIITKWPMAWFSPTDLKLATGRTSASMSA